MANVNWLNVNPLSGSGNANVIVRSTTENSGRKVRVASLKWKALNAQSLNNIDRTVNQVGRAEYVDIEDFASSGRLGGVVTIGGVSNSAKLVFTLGAGDLDINLPETYTVDLIQTPINSNIIGDPGASKAYNFNIDVLVPANDDTKSKARQIIVTDEGGHQDVCLLTVAGSKVFLIVEEGDIELDSNGSSVQVEVQSNTKWKVELEPWDNGDNLSVSYEGDGNGTALFDSDTNEGIDRETLALFVDESRNIIIERAIKQVGLREAFVGFSLADGGTFNVLKNEL